MFQDVQSTTGVTIALLSQKNTYTQQAPVPSRPTLRPVRSVGRTTTPSGSDRADGRSDRGFDDGRVGIWWDIHGFVFELHVSSVCRTGVFDLGEAYPEAYPPKMLHFKDQVFKVFTLREAYLRSIAHSQTSRPRNLKKYQPMWLWVKAKTPLTHKNAQH